MGKAESEMQLILSHLTVIYWRNIDNTTGLKHRPNGVDLSHIHRLVHRLLVLRGSIRMDEKGPEDPWQLFVDEYASGDTYNPVIEKPAFQSYPNSILLRSTSSSSSTGSCTQQQSHHDHHDDHQGHQNESNGSHGSHGSQAGVESERHIRFDSNLPGRMRHRRFPVSPAPHSRV